MKRYTGRKIHRTICGVTAALEFVSMLFLVDGISNGLVAFKLGSLLLVGGVICFAVLLWGAGALDGRE